MKLSKIDINFIDCDLDEKNELNTLLPSFKAVLTSDYDYLNEYIKTKYVYKNTTLQTSLMLACYLKDLKAVEILLNKEIGYVDLYDNSALYYAKCSKDDNIIKLIEKYEFVN